MFTCHFSETKHRSYNSTILGTGREGVALKADSEM